MGVKYVLDAHPLIWYLEGNPRLSSTAKSLMDDPSSDLVLPAIALAEALHVVAKGRTAIPNPAGLLSDVTVEPRIEIYPLTVDILRESLKANTIPEMHDRLITATAMFLQNQGNSVVLVTRDPVIAAANLVSVVW
ncbi:MAG TPA: PIN domain-containing protein [Blastocatellia bacterium]|nr:PIN domain-containing protein [Blastocatellia bacterium]